MGLRSLRTWAFNEGFPSSPGNYSEEHGRGLDYVIAGAGRRGMRVELALANFWAAYLGPEKWLTFAEGTSTGKTVADFYRQVWKQMGGHHTGCQCDQPLLIWRHTKPLHHCCCHSLATKALCRVLKCMQQSACSRCQGVALVTQCVPLCVPSPFCFVCLPACLPVCCRSQKALALLQDNIVTITSRVNSITGVAYKDNPTIIGYNLFNEPR